MQSPHSWAAWYNTWLLIKLTPKVVSSLLFFSVRTLLTIPILLTARAAKHIALGPLSIWVLLFVDQNCRVGRPYRDAQGRLLKETRLVPHITSSA